MIRTEINEASQQLHITHTLLQTHIHYYTIHSTHRYIIITHAHILTYTLHSPHIHTHYTQLTHRHIYKHACEKKTYVPAIVRWSPHVLGTSNKYEDMGSCMYGMSATANANPVLINWCTVITWNFDI